MRPTDEILPQGLARIRFPSISGLSWVVSLARGLRVWGRFRDATDLDVCWGMTGGIKLSQTLTSIHATAWLSAPGDGSTGSTCDLIYGSR